MQRATTYNKEGNMKEKLNKALNDIDEELIHEALTATHAEHKALRIAGGTVAGIAAVAAVAVAIGLGIRANAPDGVDLIQPSASTALTTTTIIQNEEQGDLSETDLTEFPCVYADTQWGSRVYFGSEFPYILYADDETVIFTEGMNSVFVYNYPAVPEEIVGNFFETAVNYTLSVQYIADRLPFYCGADNTGWDGITPFVALENGKPQIYLDLFSYTTGNDPQQLYYRLNKQTEQFELCDSIPERYTPVTQAEGNSAVTEQFNLLSEPVWIDEDNCVFIANNGRNNDVFPDEGSHLPMVSVVRYNIKTGIVQEYQPFFDLEYYTAEVDMSDWHAPLDKEYTTSAREVCRYVKVAEYYQSISEIPYIYAEEGSPVYAVEDGEVLYSGWYDTDGRSVHIALDSGELVTYSHLSSDYPVPQQGERVSKGDIIGNVGPSEKDDMGKVKVHAYTEKQAEKYDVIFPPIYSDTQEPVVVQDNEALRVLLAEKMAQSDYEGDGLPAKLVFPLDIEDYQVISYHGYDEWRDGMHYGIDIAGYRDVLGENILAIDGGKVIRVVDEQAPTFHVEDIPLGNYLIIDHGNEEFSLYAHCENIAVSEGDMVSGGDIIATVGSTGFSTGPHLHFEIFAGGESVDPFNYLS